MSLNQADCLVSDYSLPFNTKSQTVQLILVNEPALCLKTHYSFLVRFLAAQVVIKTASWINVNLMAMGLMLCVLFVVLTKTEGGLVLPLLS